MPNKEQMLARHEAHLDRLEYELGLFTNAGVQTEPPESKDSLEQHLRKALESEREIIEILKHLRGISTTVAGGAQQ